MRESKTVLCRLHSRSQPRYPRFTLCPDCHTEAPREAIVVEAVVNYFSKSEFREFFIETEHEIQMGSDTRRADIVLFDKEGYFIAIAECKKINDVSYGLGQLKSYLCATDTQFGVFANSTNPDEWEFYENLRQNRFTASMERFPFERKIAMERTIESIREEKNKLDQEILKASDQYAQKTREADSSCKQLDELNEKIERKNKQLAQIKEEVAPLRKESSDLKGEITRLKGEITQISKRAKVVKGLKLESTRDSLRKTIDLLSIEKDQLQNEIGMKEQQHTRLSEKINLLREDKGKLESFLKENRDKLKRRENKIRYDRESLKREQEKSKTLKHTNNYLDEINAKLQRQIDHKTSAIPELDRLSKLDELEAAFAQESIYGQLQKEFERLEELESKIARKQQLARQDQEKHAAYERNRLETNEKEQQLVQVSQEKESTLKQLRVVVNQLKTANLEQNSQIEVNRKQLVQDLRKHKCRCVQLTREISELKGIKSSLEEEIRQEGQQVLFEEGEACPAYVKIQLEIDELKIEKSKIEAKIGHQIFLRLP